MELRSVDPRLIKPNPENPRKIAPDEQADRALVGSIEALGILQPPVVRQKDEELILVAGERRLKAAIKLDLKTIEVLVRTEDDEQADNLRSVSENVVRASMSPVDLWRAIDKLTSANWTEAAIAAALAIPARTVKQLKHLGHIHPAILEQIGAGDMPREDSLRLIAAATPEEQAAVWKKHKPKKGQAASWWEIARALEKRRLYASAAKFGAAEEEAFGIVWEEDLFSQGDEDSRYTTQVEAFFAAQQAWLESQLPKNGVILPVDDYGQAKLPPKAERIWTKPKKTDVVGKWVNPRDGSIGEIAYRLQAPAARKGASAATTEPADEDVAPAKKPRAEITQKGHDIIGDLRTDALTKALAENPIDDGALIGLLVLTLNAGNVAIRDGNSSIDRTKIAQQITQGGKLSQDLNTLRQAARDTVASVLSCRTGFTNSGVISRIAGDSIGADAHLANMANETFLACLSKAAIETVAASLGVLPRQRAKETRAAVIQQVGEGSFVHPAALFAPSAAELAAHNEERKSYAYGASDCDDDSDGDGDELIPASADDPLDGVDDRKAEDAEADDAPESEEPESDDLEGEAAGDADGDDGDDDGDDFGEETTEENAHLQDGGGFDHHIAAE